jgi:hypothetical protein
LFLCLAVREVIRFQHLLFEEPQGKSGFDLTTGVFKAPVSGLYHFDVMVYHKSGDFWFGIATVSGTTVKLVKAEAGMQGYQGDGREISLPVSANLLLKKGDEVAAIHLHGITAAPVDSAQDVNGTRTNQFTGYLISAFDVESN